MHHRNARRSLELDDEVAVGDSIHAVLAYPAESQLPGQKITIDGIGHTGQRTAPQWQDISALEGVTEALHIALEHLEIGQQVMGEKHRLRPLQVGITRHNFVPICLRNIEKSAL